eukprot:3812604-Pyramimonas_sp.AAC.1
MAWCGRFGRARLPGGNIPALPASDWSVMRIYPRFLRLIGPIILRSLLRPSARHALHSRSLVTEPISVYSLRPAM